MLMPIASLPLTRTPMPHVNPSAIMITRNFDNPYSFLCDSFYRGDFVVVVCYRSGWDRSDKTKINIFQIILENQDTYILIFYILKFTMAKILQLILIWI